MLMNASIIKAPAAVRETDENFVVDPRRKREYTKKEKILNFLYYYKWWLVLGVLITVILFQIVSSALGFGVVKPDYCIACITGTGLSEEVQSELEKAFAELGEDLNGDGTVKVSVIQYLTGNPIDPENTAYYGYASEIKLQADIIGCDSFVFISEDPEDVQRRYQILADSAGNLPENNNYSAEGRAFLWSDSPALDAMELTEETRRAVSDLYVSRRGYADISKVPFYDKNNEFWQKLAAGS